MNCTNLISLKLYRINCLTDQDIKFMLCNPRLSEQLRELELDRVFELHTMSYEVIHSILYYYHIAFPYTFFHFGG